MSKGWKCPIIYAENDRKENSSELGELLRNLGYRLHLAPAASVFSGQLVGEQNAGARLTARAQEWTRPRQSRGT